MSTSYQRGPDVPLIEKTIHELVRDTAARIPDQEAIVSRHENRRLTWREFYAESQRVAEGLRGLGLNAQDRIGIWSTNCIQWLEIQVACSMANLALVNVNPAYRAKDLGYILRKSRMRALILRERDARSDYKKILEETGAIPEHVIYLDDPSWDAMLARGKAIENRPATPADIANIQYTSGTTGAPKGVLLAHRGMVNNGWYGAARMAMTDADRVLINLPLYHVGACVCWAIAAYHTGATIVLPSAQFDALATLQGIHEERVTIGGGVPTMLIAMLEHPQFATMDYSSLRLVATGAAPCPIDLMQRVVAKTGAQNIFIFYGQTEASGGITTSVPGDSLEVAASTVGRVYPNTEVKIVSPAGETVPLGEQGEICCRGAIVMKGYDEEPEATARALDSEGWLRTGDLGVMNADGYLNITGRAKEMIIRGGENIFPREIEDFLIAHPKISDAQVVGLPDAKLGEAVLCWIRLKPGESATEEEIRAFCQNRIAHFKIPQYIRFVDQFPMTVSGKVQKFAIRDQEVRERDLESVAKARTA
ncbi:MAG: AMP-binding protein [Acidobacteriia bacterium]|nr:AMP-binding protein [Terriglobia bacterium]